MSEDRVIRINKVLRELNISLERAVDYLKDKGIAIDANPNAKISEKEFKHQQGHQIGGFAFGFEEGQAFLTQLMVYDHQGRKLQELVEFPKTISQLTPQSLSQISLEALSWDKLTIVVVGDKSLEKSLSRIRPVRVLNFEDFL
jgi:predicted Zn-dependent peptidase